MLAQPPPAGGCLRTAPQHTCTKPPSTHGCSSVCKAPLGNPATAAATSPPPPAARRGDRAISWSSATFLHGEAPGGGLQRLLPPPLWGHTELPGTALCKRLQMPPQPPARHLPASEMPEGVGGFSPTCRIAAMQKVQSEQQGRKFAC